MAESSGYAYRTTYNNGGQTHPYQQFDRQLSYLPLGAPQYYLQPPPFQQQTGHSFHQYPYYNLNNQGSQYQPNYSGYNRWIPSYSPQYNHYHYAQGGGSNYDGNKNAVEGAKGETGHKSSHSYDKGGAGKYNLNKR